MKKCRHTDRKTGDEWVMCSEGDAPVTQKHIRLNKEVGEVISVEGRRLKSQSSGRRKPWLKFSRLTMNKHIHIWSGRGLAIPMDLRHWGPWHDRAYVIWGYTCSPHDPLGKMTHCGCQLGSTKIWVLFMRKQPCHANEQGMLAGCHRQKKHTQETEAVFPTEVLGQRVWVNELSLNQTKLLSFCLL